MGIDFCQMLSALIGMIMFSVFILLTCCINLFLYIEPPLHSMYKSHLVMVYDPFNVLSLSLIVFSLGFLHQYSLGNLVCSLLVSLSVLGRRIMLAP